MENPYTEALEWIKKANGSGSALGLAKLILSLWNLHNCFSYRECVTAFDATRMAYAEKIILHFNRHGEDQYLVDAGYKVMETYPRLGELGYAGTAAKSDLEDRWLREEEQELEKMEGKDE